MNILNILIGTFLGFGFYLFLTRVLGTDKIDAAMLYLLLAIWNSHFMLRKHLK